MFNFKLRVLVYKIDMDIEFKKYVEDLMCFFNIGIKLLGIEKKNIKEFFGEDNENEFDKFIKEVEDFFKKMLGLRSRCGDELILVKENGIIWVKSLKIEYFLSGNFVFFDLDEELDGIIRLLDFVLVFKNVILFEKVYVVDEIERSIYLLLIKEFVKKFLLDNGIWG